ncbi:MAG TPA: histidine triad nucleotide-binding protein [Acidimicrobiales bacterium]|nr:histidine triad nucleotide-binding protein [Acidimicrobiales bacterium]
MSPDAPADDVAHPPVEGCPFCAIVAGDLPARVVWETGLVIAFRDIAPVAPVHVLLVPRVHVPDALSLDASHAALLAELAVVGRRVAEAEGIASSGYRLVFNVGDDGGNTVSHLHLHLLGGRPMAWPPG